MFKHRIDMKENFLAELEKMYLFFGDISITGIEIHIKERQWLISYNFNNILI